MYFFCEFSLLLVELEKWPSRNEVSDQISHESYFLVELNGKFVSVYYYMGNFCNLIGLEQWYFNLIWNTYMWKLQTFCG